MKNIVLSFIAFQLILIIGCKKDDNTIGPKSNQGEWKQVRTSQNDVYYHAISFADQNNGWAVGDSGKILHTSDGGNSWLVQKSGTIASLKSVYFINSQKGWIGGGNNSFGMTTNGGITWSWQNPAGESRRTFMSISFIDEQRGWIVDNFSGILHTEDGGTTLIPQKSGTTWAITSVQFLDAQEGWATATNSVVLHTTDGGNNWITKILDSLDCGNVGDYNDIFFISHSKGWIATNNVFSNIANPVSPIVHTSDAGKTWVCQPMQTPMTTALQFINENLGWTACWNEILYTSNGGGTWIKQLEDSSSLFVDLCFLDRPLGWAITFTGNIYRYQAL
jgi:photosystem II stability/assembly factor-like uncharacterized protein